MLKTAIIGTVHQLLKLAITPGCPSGVGPEVTAKALAALPEEHGVELLYSGPARVLKEGARVAQVSCESLEHGLRINHQKIRCLPEGDTSAQPHCVPGKPDARALAIQRDGLHHAIAWAKDGDVHGIVTAPIRKASIQDLAEGSFPGQTELLHFHLAVDDEPPMMCFLGGPCILGLCTIHVPLARVSQLITTETLEQMIRRLRSVTESVQAKKASSARIVVLGLNPHAGEGGLLGAEDAQIIEPVVNRFQEKGWNIQGPVPADGFFANLAKTKMNDENLGVLAMYHDQGLGPYKVLAGGASVNLTWGLRVPRTSPDHGTADDIAGQGVADETAMLEAIIRAKQLVLNSKKAER